MISASGESGFPERLMDSIASKRRRHLRKFLIIQNVSSFGELSRHAWMTLGVAELVCALGLVVPDTLHWKPSLTIVATTVLAV